MSSPPPASSDPVLDFPTSDDVEMGDDTRPTPRGASSNPLFLQGTPSTKGTPSQRRQGTPSGPTPMREMLSRRVPESSFKTPTKVPLFNRACSLPLSPQVALIRPSISRELFSNWISKHVSFKGASGIRSSRVRLGCLGVARVRLSRLPASEYVLTPFIQFPNSVHT